MNLEPENEENIVPSNKIASQTIDELESELNKFRIEWRKELLDQDKKETNANSNTKPKYEVTYSNRLSTSVNSESIKPKNVAVYHQFPQRPKIEPKPILVSQDLSAESDLQYDEPKTNEDKARYLFGKGVILEQQGRHYEGFNLNIVF